MKDIRMTAYKKVGREWKVTEILTEAFPEVWERLATDLVNKKLAQCKYIRKVTYGYNGAIETITVYYDNGCKCRYEIGRWT